MLDTVARPARRITLAGALLGAAACGGESAMVAASGAGGASSSSGAGGGAVVPACEGFALAVDGALDGQHFHVAPPLRSAGGTSKCFTGLSEGHGLLRLSTPQSFGQIGVVASDRGFLRLPATDGGTGTWLCRDAPSAVILEAGSAPSGLGKISFTWPSLRELGVCPGTPVNAALTFEPMVGLSGTLDGASIAIPSTASMTTESGKWESHDLGDCGVLEVLHTTDPPRGVILLPSSVPGADAVFCVDGITKDGAGFTLQGVSRLGGCSEESGSGSLGVCIEF